MSRPDNVILFPGCGLVPVVQDAPRPSADPPSSFALGITVENGELVVWCGESGADRTRFLTVRDLLSFLRGYRGSATSGAAPRAPLAQEPFLTARLRLMQCVASLDEADAENMLFYVGVLMREWARQEADGGEGEPSP